MNKKQKSDKGLVRQFKKSSSKDNKDLIGIIEDEDYAIAIGKKHDSNESGSKPKEQTELIEKDKDNIRLIVGKSNAKKIKGKDGKKLNKLLKILREELTEKRSNKLHIYDNLEKLFKKLYSRKRSKSTGSSSKLSDSILSDGMHNNKLIRI